ncbi:MAG: D-aminoacyl-tRNA deacylase [Halobacteria archaeon]
MIGILVSLEDVASTNIRDSLLEKADWREVEGGWRASLLGHGGTDTVAGKTAGDSSGVSEEFLMVEREGLHLYLDGVDIDIEERHGVELDLLVFVSRHSGDSGEILTAHHTGNFGSADHGGERESLARPAPSALKQVLTHFDRDTGFEACMEATHHGPSEIDTPSLFVEIGSSREEWVREDMADAVADAVLDVELLEADKVLAGVGGGHYCPRYTRLVLNTDVTFGHVAADYALEDLDVELQELMVDGAHAVIESGEGSGFDWKLDVPVVSEKTVRRRSGVPRESAVEIEGLIEGEGEGGETPLDRGDTEPELTRRAEQGCRAPRLYTCVDLASEARKIDRDNADSVIDEYALGYGENEDGVLEAVVVEHGDEDVLTEELAEVLEGKYAEVEVDVNTEGESSNPGEDEDCVVRAVREVFDPGKARELGVPEGPLFGRLSKGEEVDLDGETVTPDMVTRKEELRFEIQIP